MFGWEQVHIFSDCVKIINMSPATVEKHSAIIDKYPATVGKRPVAIEKTPATVGKFSVNIGEYPAVVGKRPADQKIVDELQRIFLRISA